MALKTLRAERKSILVVDDDADIRNTLQEVLEDEGYQVMVAADGIQALSVLRSQGTPGLILLDLMMPGMNGCEFIIEKAKDPALAGIPVAILTADGGFRDVPQELVARYLRKPIKLEVLLELVKEFV